MLCRCWIVRKVLSSRQVGGGRDEQKASIERVENLPFACHELGNAAQAVDGERKSMPPSPSIERSSECKGMEVGVVRKEESWKQKLSGRKFEDVHEGGKKIWARVLISTSQGQ